MRHDSIRIGWVLISYFMIAGGLLLVFALWQTLHIKSVMSAYAACFLGAALGGFFAGRASEGQTIVEPVIGALLLVLSFIALFSLVAGLRSLVALGDGDVLGPLLGLAGTLALGAVLGAMLSERTSPAQPSDSGIRWAGLSALIVLGQFYMFFLFGAILLLRGQGDEISVGSIMGMIFGVLTLTAFFGGFTAQSVAPRPMTWACGAGFALALVPSVLVSPNAIIGAVILAGLGTLVGALGAKLGWAMFGANRAALAEDAAA